MQKGNGLRRGWDAWRGPFLSRGKNEEATELGKQETEERERKNRHRGMQMAASGSICSKGRNICVAEYCVKVEVGPLFHSGRETGGMVKGGNGTRRRRGEDSLSIGRVFRAEEWRRCRVHMNTRCNTPLENSVGRHDRFE